MTFKIVHRGYVLTQQQITACIPVLRRSMNRYASRTKQTKAELEQAVDDELVAAGCPITDDQERADDD